MIVEYGRDYLSYIQRWDDHTKATKYTEFSYWELSKYLDFNNSHVSDHYPDYLGQSELNTIFQNDLFSPITYEGRNLFQVRKIRLHQCIWSECVTPDSKINSKLIQKVEIHLAL